ARADVRQELPADLRRAPRPGREADRRGIQAPPRRASRVRAPADPSGDDPRAPGARTAGTAAMAGGRRHTRRSARRPGPARIARESLDLDAHHHADYGLGRPAGTRSHRYDARAAGDRPATSTGGAPARAD